MQEYTKGRAHYRVLPELHTNASPCSKTDSNSAAGASISYLLRFASTYPQLYRGKIPACGERATSNPRCGPQSREGARRYARYGLCVGLGRLECRKIYGSSTGVHRDKPSRIGC